MKEQIEKLIRQLRENAASSESKANDIIRDIGIRGQDEMLAKVYNAFANDLQRIVENANCPDTGEAR